jgi:hypothetical protein
MMPQRDRKPIHPKARIASRSITSSASGSNSVNDDRMNGSGLNHRARAQALAR